MREIIWSKINWLDIGQDTEIQYIEVAKQPISVSNIVKNYFRVLEVISSLNYELVYKSDVGRKQKISDFALLGDRGYLSQSIQLDLFQTVKIKLETPRGANQKDYKPQPYICRKSRKRIETLFSQLCDQFRIRNNYAKTFEGFKTRILAKIIALTLIQYINKFIFERPINNIKN